MPYTLELCVVRVRIRTETWSIIGARELVVYTAGTDISRTGAAYNSNDNTRIKLQHPYTFIQCTRDSYRRKKRTL